MSKPGAELYFLLVRPDFDDPDTLNAGVLALPVLVTTNEGEAVHTFLVEVDEVVKLDLPDPGMRTIKIFGRLLTGERVIYKLIYDDSHFTQMLSVESIDDSSVE